MHRVKQAIVLALSRVSSRELTELEHTARRVFASDSAIFIIHLLHFRLLIQNLKQTLLGGRAHGCIRRRTSATTRHQQRISICSSSYGYWRNVPRSNLLLLLAHLHYLHS